MTLEAFSVISQAFSYAFVWMSFAWLLHLFLSNAATADAACPISVLIYALTYAVKSPYIILHEWLLLFVVGLWAVRKSSHIFIDRIYKKSEDEPYISIRKKWNKLLPVKFFFYFQKKTIFALFLSVPFFLLATEQGANETLIYLGVCISLIGIAGEMIADLQLKYFKLQSFNQTEPCQIGLWKYSSHPHFAFGLIFWIGIACMGQATPNGHWAWIAPAMALSRICIDVLCKRRR